MIQYNSRILAVLTSVIGVYACSGAKATAPTPLAPIPSVTSARARVVTNPKPDDDATRGTVNVSQDIRSACGLADDDAHFAFDSAHVVKEDRRMLRTLADCFVSGPLRGHQMSLVGHADPRGSEDYNIALAGRRADNVKEIIVAETMPEGRVSTTSRGAMDATGTNEVSWANDRRVDVFLGK
jgi:peptidoglycan-associated lipoprotein